VTLFISLFSEKVIIMSNFHNGPIEIFFFPWNYASATFLKLEPNALAVASGQYRGATIVNQSGQLTLSTSQLQAIGNAIRMHLATGSISVTIGGVQLATYADGTLDVTFASITTNLDNDSAGGLATSVLRYVVSGPPAPASGGPTFVDMSL